MSATRVLIISHDVVDESMAGPGIRYWELARVLAQHCSVTLAVPGQTTLSSEEFALEPYRPDDWGWMRSAAEQADVIMPCGFVIHRFPRLIRLGCPIVMDMYDPYPAETLVLMANRPAEERAAYHQSLVERLRLECRSGDFFLCASERQRFWWLGVLAAHGRLNTATFQSDPTLRSLIDVVPFGCGSELLRHKRQVLKGVMPGISQDDKVLLWGGGIWEWLDPLTLLSALRQVVDRRPDVRLVFPGTQHPNKAVPDMIMRQRAIELARELELLDTHAFFGSWVPYADWSNYLLEADVGVSLHFDSLEAQLAFRSRVLDYIRAGIPMIVTKGDATSQIVASYGLGIVVDYESVEDVVGAIFTLLDEPSGARQAKFSKARDALAWSHLARPLVSFCCAPHKAADHHVQVEPPQTPEEIALASQVVRLEEVHEQQQAEIAELRALIQNYEQGRFIRLMRQVQHWRERLNL